MHREWLNSAFYPLIDHYNTDSLSIHKWQFLDLKRAKMKSRNLSDLYLFCQSVRHGGYVAASKVTGVSASSLSRAVSQLEASLGEKLIHRTAKQFNLTAQGHLCFQRFDALFEAIDEKWIEQTNLQNKLVGDIRISCPEPFADNFLNAMALEFMAKHPDVNIHISFATKANDFFEKQMDLAVCTSLPDIPQLVQRKLMSMPFVLVASPAYLKEKGKPKAISDLQDHRLLTSSDTPFWEFEVQGKTIKLPFKPRFLIDNPRTITKAACTGLGISLVPEATIKNMVDEGTLEIVLPKAQVKKGEVFLVWADQHLIARRIKEFKDTIINRLNKDELLSAISIDS